MHIHHDSILWLELHYRERLAIRRYDAHAGVRVPNCPNNRSQLDLIWLQELSGLCLDYSFESTRIDAEKVIAGEAALVGIEGSVIVLS